MLKDNEYDEEIYEQKKNIVEPKNFGSEEPKVADEIENGEKALEGIVQEVQDVPVETNPDFSELITDNVDEIAGMNEEQDEEQHKGHEGENEAAEVEKLATETEIDVNSDDNGEIGKHEDGEGSKGDVKEIKPAEEAVDKESKTVLKPSQDAIGEQKSMVQFETIEKKKDSSTQLLPPSTTDQAIQSLIGFEFQTKPKKSVIYSYGELGSRIESVTPKDVLEHFGIFTTEAYNPHSLFGEIEEQEEEMSIKEEEIKQSVLDRKPYYDKYDMVSPEIAWKKIKNFILQKKLVMHLRKRKIITDYKETEFSYDALKKYHLKLEAYGELNKYRAIKQLETTKKINELKKKEQEKSNEVTELFQQLQRRERETGIGLIYVKTGNVLPDKVVDFFIKRQSKRMQVLTAMRLEYCKLKIMVQEKLDGINAINEIAPGYFMHVYERLKQDNRSYADKMEEYDTELCRLRAKFSNSVNILAHMKEKSAAFRIDLDDLDEELLRLDCDYYEIRSNMSKLKQTRMNYMKDIANIKRSSGLLTEPSLLRQMEIDMENYQHDSGYLSELKNEYKIKTKKVKNARKNIQQITALMKRTKVAV